MAQEEAPKPSWEIIPKGAEMQQMEGQLLQAAVYVWLKGKLNELRRDLGPALKSLKADPRIGLVLFQRLEGAVSMLKEEHAAEIQSKLKRSAE
ncbi:MAG: hypothetical protein HYT39_04160 [Candidatus Sungbacteria bacterium]|nr:hypothetical protein [Candidatus Sungbacteria bacterium]